MDTEMFAENEPNRGCPIECCVAMTSIDYDMVVRDVTCDFGLRNKNIFVVCEIA